MSRSLSQTLIRFSNSHSSSSSSSSSMASRFVKVRHRSNSPEVFSGEVPATEEIERVGLKNLEDAIHSMIVKKSQPDWIHLVPGASYWVPPKSKSQGLAHVITKLANHSTTTTSMINNKSLYLSSNRGWPSSAHFFKGASHSPLEGEITTKHTSQSEDEEG